MTVTLCANGLGCGRAGAGDAGDRRHFHKVYQQVAHRPTARAALKTGSNLQRAVSRQPCRVKFACPALLFVSMQQRMMSLPNCLTTSASSFSTLEARCRGEGSCKIAERLTALDTPSGALA